MKRADVAFSGVIAALLLVTIACSPAGAPAASEPLPPATVKEFNAAFCVAFDEFTLAVGNDAGAKGPEAAALQKAMVAGAPGRRWPPCPPFARTPRSSAGSAG
jgi:hypothetical protein